MLGILENFFILRQYYPEPGLFVIELSQSERR